MPHVILLAIFAQLTHFPLSGAVSAGSGHLFRRETSEGATAARHVSRFVLDAGSTVVTNVLVPGVARAGEGTNLMFVTDCTPHQKWMAFSVFNSARLVNQDEPITWIRAGCDPGEDASRHGLADIAKAMYPKAGLVEVSSQKMKDFNLGFGVPKALYSFFLQKTMEAGANRYPDDAVVALIEADMIFLDRLHTKGFPPVAGKNAVAQHYLCCDDLGPPYFLSAGAWKELIPVWTNLSSEHHGGGWGGDQVAFAEAARKIKMNFTVNQNFMVSAPDEDGIGEGWALVEESLKTSAGDVCATKRFGKAPGVESVPTFMHVVRPWMMGNGTEEAWGFSKYQVAPGWQHESKSDGILECSMPRFAEPNFELLQMESGSVEQRSGWAICTIIHSLNSMLENYKRVGCPRGHNLNKAFKMVVPLDWRNELIGNWEESVPEGADKAWLERCATKLQC